jgi:hypothetical protein
MLTCAKGSLVFSTPDFMKSKLSRRHGISTNNDFKNSLDLNTEAVQVSGDGVYSLVRAALGFEPLSASSSTQVQHILTRLPEVDGWYRLLFGKGTDPLDWIKLSGPIVVPAADGYHVGFNLLEEFHRSIEPRLPASVKNNFNVNVFKHSNGEMFVGFSSNPGRVSQSHYRLRLTSSFKSAR